jgi:hypothetical protein
MMKNLTRVWLVITCLTLGFGFAQESTTDLNEDIHLVAQASTDQVAVDGTVEIEYRLYVSLDIGITSWNVVEKPLYDGFSFETIKLDNISIENSTYNGKPYRMVILKKDVVTATKSGDYSMKPLELEVVARVAISDAKNNGLKIPMKQVKTTMVSNVLKVNVKS